MHINNSQQLLGRCRKIPYFHCNFRQYDGIIENVVTIRLSMKLDSNDLKLIELLKQDSRASVTSLADTMGIARVTTHDRWFD